MQVTNLKTWDQHVGLLALMMLLIPQVQHTIYVYENNSQHGGYITTNCASCIGETVPPISV